MTSSSHWVRDENFVKELNQHSAKDAIKTAVTKMLIVENLKKQGVSEEEAKQMLVSQFQKNLDQNEYQRLMAMVKE